MRNSIKWIFWLSIAANVIFFAVMQLSFNGQSASELYPMHEEKITLRDLSESEPVQAPTLEVASPESMSVSAPVAVSVAASAPVALVTKELACFEWGDFSGSELVRAEAALKKLKLGDKFTQHEVDRNINFWVYIAPLKDKAAANQKIAQLKARGVSDYFVMQEPAEWLNAISLGVFRSRESAQKFLEDMHAKNVSSAQMGERSSKTRATLFMINNLDADMSAKLTLLQKNFSGSELKPASCH